MGEHMIKEFSDNYFKELTKILESLSLDKFEKIVNMLMDAHGGGAQIFVMGNGGSASTASHFACDINKGVSSGIDKKFKVICLNDSIPTILAYANNGTYSDIFVEQLKNFLTPEDVVIGFSTSGNSENVIKAVRHANECKAESIAFTGFDGGKLAGIAGISLVVPSRDVQKIEDTHLILMHVIMQILNRKLNGKGTTAII
jgi:D-sedoheptulose 7-phosphate isomerase